MCEETGPPTLEDDLWFTSHMDDPIKRDPKPMEGQMTLTDQPSCNCGRFRIGDTPIPHHFAYCMVERERERRIDQLDADEQRAREDEAQQFRDHR